MESKSQRLLALFLLFMCVSTIMLDNYLDYDQSYIFNFQLLFYVLLTITVIILTQALSYGVITRSAIPIFPLIGSFSVYCLLLQLGLAANTWIAFQTDWDFNGLVHLFAFWFYYWQMLDFTDGKRQLTIMVSLPILFFTTFSYLSDNQFFNRRPGSYPVYVERLYGFVVKESRVKSIDDFFVIEKTEQ